MRRFQLDPLITVGLSFHSLPLAWTRIAWWILLSTLKHIWRTAFSICFAILSTYMFSYSMSHSFALHFFQIRNLDRASTVLWCTELRVHAMLLVVIDAITADSEKAKIPRRCRPVIPFFIIHSCTSICGTVWCYTKDCRHKHAASCWELMRWT